MDPCDDNDNYYYRFHFITKIVSIFFFSVFVPLLRVPFVKRHTTFIVSVYIIMKLNLKVKRFQHDLYRMLNVDMLNATHTLTHERQTAMNSTLDIH